MNPINAILAGIMIAIGGTVNLSIGGIMGAILFSLGLYTVVVFHFELFTGKAHLLSNATIFPKDLFLIWCGNFIGVLIVALMIHMTPLGNNLYDAANAIFETRIGNGFLANTILGIFCGLLMYIAVEGWSKTKNPLFVIMPVSVFILCGFNHCIADMFYISIASSSFSDYLLLIPTTLGNLIGCNLILILDKIKNKNL